MDFKQTFYSSEEVIYHPQSLRLSPGNVLRSYFLSITSNNYGLLVLWEKTGSSRLGALAL